jgi:hypothetical protein
MQTSSHTSAVPIYLDAVVKRAERGLACAPFTLQLFADMAERGISLRSLTTDEGKKYLTVNINLVLAENSLLWLVQVGVLRREVDGQGITDSFRLTPLGHYLLSKWQPQGNFNLPTWSDRWQNRLAQWQPSRFF